MEARSSPPSEAQPPIADPADPTAEIHPLELIDDGIRDEKRRRRKKNTEKENRKIKGKKKLNNDEASSSSSSCSCSSSLPMQSSSTSLPNPTRRASRVAPRSRNPTVRLGTARRTVGEQQVDSLALPLGMSIAAFVNLVLERNNAADQNVPVNDLAVICASAVRESLANVYGNKFGSFAGNFERSFRSTLRTLRLINEASPLTRERHQLDCNDGDSVSDCSMRNVCSEMELPVREPSYVTSMYEEIQDRAITSSSTGELTLQEDTRQLSCITRNPSLSRNNQMTTIERSLVVEQARANDLKSLEIGLTMRKLRLKETELALNYESNNLERSKLEIGVSKASFKAEKFKTELGDTRQAELLKRCIDCLVAGLFIMLASLLYGAYVFSYQKIIEATAVCVPSPEERSSWWMPKRVSSMSSGWSTLKCQVRVATQMLFGLLMILTISYSIIIRSSSCKQTMPVTFILLLLGVLCGLAGKFCVDTLGGNGYHWLAFWETLCLVHFFSNIFTSALFAVLYGPVTVTKQTNGRPLVPYWARRALFYTTILFFLPLLSGLIPFAGFHEWKEHFAELAMEYRAKPFV
ncbi:PREDICTED: protein CPR-5 [Tarenaya hassleriana]|uniref:protein CPR-5 n=1 Tax=Tarenaya hassleriana TaxID=28532 RepID=UPI00053C840A|nr:PREDICTED: protein CPR-5 [Tarenaya hassleriana]